MCLFFWFRRTDWHFIQLHKMVYFFNLFYKEFCKYGRWISYFYPPFVDVLDRVIYLHQVLCPSEKGQRQKKTPRKRYRFINEVQKPLRNLDFPFRIIIWPILYRRAVFLVAPRLLKTRTVIRYLLLWVLPCLFCVFNSKGITLVL